MKDCCYRLWWLTCSSPSHQPVEFLASTTISCPGDRWSWCIVGAAMVVAACAISVDTPEMANNAFRSFNFQENNRINQRMLAVHVCVCSHHVSWLELQVLMPKLDLIIIIKFTNATLEIASNTDSYNIFKVNSARLTSGSSTGRT